MNGEQSPLREVLLEVCAARRCLLSGADRLEKAISEFIGPNLLRGDGTIVHPREVYASAQGAHRYRDDDSWVRPRSRIYVLDRDDAGGAT